MRKITKAILPVGGLGTRFLPATKAIPKEMLPVASKPLIQYAFEEAQAAGIEQFIFVTGRNKNAIINHFDHSYELQDILSNKDKQLELGLAKSWLPSAGAAVFIRQQNALGLGHAILCAKHLIGDEPFAVLLADEMLQVENGFLAHMVKDYERVGGNIVALAEVSPDQVHKYGIIDPAAKQTENLIAINNMVEKPSKENAPSCLSITGRYILQADIFQFLEETEPGTGGEVQLTDAMVKMLLAGHQFWGSQCKEPRFDCGSEIGFLEANIAYSLANEAHREKTLSILRKYIK